MNTKSFKDKELKVEFAKGPKNDRGGHRGGRDNDRRGPPRDFGDRPKGCFNCGEDGHFARECPKRKFNVNPARQPREFNRDRGGDRSRGDYRGGDRRGDRGGRDGHYDRSEKDRREKNRKNSSSDRSRSRDAKKKKYRKKSSSSSHS